VPEFLGAFASSGWFRFGFTEISIVIAGVINVSEIFNCWSSVNVGIKHHIVIVVYSCRPKKGEENLRESRYYDWIGLVLESYIAPVL